ncbi:hypothetical protein R6Q59_018852 [Mikania micrantha]
MNWGLFRKSYQNQDTTTNCKRSIFSSAWVVNGARKRTKSGKTKKGRSLPCKCRPKERNPRGGEVVARSTQKPSRSGRSSSGSGESRLGQQSEKKEKKEKKEMVKLMRWGKK